MIKHILSLLLLVVIWAPVSSQNFTGLKGSSYAGINSIYHNPALMVDSRMKLDVNILTTNVAAGNNFLSYEYLTNEFFEDLSEKKKNVYFNLDVRGPSAMYTFDGRSVTELFQYFTVAIHSRVRVAVSVSNMNPNTAQLAFRGLEDSSVQKLNYFDPEFNIDAMAWTELGVSGGRTIVENGKHFVHAGLHIKKLTGGASMFFRNKNARFYGENEDTLIIRDVDFTYGYSDENLFGNIRDENLYEVPGSGIGMDIGLVYEFREDRYKRTYKQRLTNSENKYLYRFGVALIDFGKINFNGYRSRVVRYTGDNFVSRAEMDSIGKPDDVNKLSDRKFEKQEEVDGYKMSLPTHLNFTADLNIGNGLYVNAGWVLSLRNQNKPGVNQPDFFSLIPRFEKKGVEFALPVSLRDFDNLEYGFMARFGVVTLGADNIRGAISGKVKNADVYLALRIPIYRK
ncbi:MAG: hypothetical protein ACJATA_000547 [Sphingobacteriales bacterium]|jgi:hypothetical protein